MEDLINTYYKADRKTQKIALEYLLNIIDADTMACFSRFIKLLM